MHEELDTIINTPIPTHAHPQHDQRLWMLTIVFALHSPFHALLFNMVHDYIQFNLKFYPHPPSPTTKNMTELLKQCAPLCTKTNNIQYNIINSTVY